jgi:hypothetical protein
VLRRSAFLGRLAGAEHRRVHEFQARTAMPDRAMFRAVAKPTVSADRDELPADVLGCAT